MIHRLEGKTIVTTGTEASVGAANAAVAAADASRVNQALAAADALGDPAASGLALRLRALQQDVRREAEQVGDPLRGYAKASAGEGGDDYIVLYDIDETIVATTMRRASAMLRLSTTLDCLALVLGIHGVELRS